MEMHGLIFFYFIVFRFFQIFSTSHYEGADLRLVSFTEGCVQGPQDGRSECLPLVLCA